MKVKQRKKTVRKNWNTLVRPLLDDFENHCRACPVEECRYNNSKGRCQLGKKLWLQFRVKYTEYWVWFREPW